ncbi:MAG: prolyl oligopeptidase family serine peptidase [Bacteroidetes bacterium]|nr:prolyl oligopeptidase family serine peptidase [Bacteroidota bacterium]
MNKIPLLIGLLLLSLSVYGRDETQKINVGNEVREYIVHVPAQKKREKLPVVFLFHGGGGTARHTISFLGMNAVADTAGFLVVYPNGLQKGWNDGREVKKHTHDDIGFIAALIEKIKRDFPVDDQRIFATGISNGGFFSFALALHLSEKFRAIAPVCASIPSVLMNHYTPKNPVPLLLINGTKDPLVPYSGGEVGGKWFKNRGQCTSTDDTIAKFLTLNHCIATATTSALPDRDPHDGCTATRLVYSCKKNQEVQLIKVEGGGHTWPGGKQYLGKRLVGTVCRDFSANAEVWNFFRTF